MTQLSFPLQEEGFYSFIPPIRLLIEIQLPWILLLEANAIRCIP